MVMVYVSNVFAPASAHGCCASVPVLEESESPSGCVRYGSGPDLSLAGFSNELAAVASVPAAILILPDWKPHGGLRLASSLLFARCVRRNPLIIEAARRTRGVSAVTNLPTLTGCRRNAWALACVIRVANAGPESCPFKANSYPKKMKH